MTKKFNLIELNKNDLAQIKGGDETEPATYPYLCSRDSGNVKL